MAKILKIGWVLVREGVVSRPQLESILDFQKKNPALTVGEIASDLCNIPEREIETIFAEHILGQAVRAWLLNAISRKMKGIDTGKIITDIEVIINSYTRNAISQKDFVRQKDGLMHPQSDKRFLAKISSDIDRIVIKTSMKEEIVFRNFGIDFDIQGSTISAENESLVLEAKIKLIQIMKKNARAEELKVQVTDLAAPNLR